MKLPQNSWGYFPKKATRIVTKVTSKQRVLDVINSNDAVIAQGNGRSYGDSALGEHQVNLLHYYYFESFDPIHGVLKVRAGALLSDILDAFVPQGWFLSVSPGTKLITVGGAIASDVHGKNHHVEGCFSESVICMELINAKGDVERCSKEHNSDLFHATCAGQGLTGVITTVELQLKKIPSSIIQETIYKTFTLEETFKIFEENQSANYSVAWIDCMARDKGIGRSLVSIGEFAESGGFEYSPKPKLSIPMFFPGFVLNSLSVKLFNWMYFHRVRQKVTLSNKSIDQFFYPLDSIKNWNKIYGKNGFIQYQFIIPYEASLDGIREVLDCIAKSRKGSFLAVLKLYGEENDNWLSFPMAGYSLALDFKVTHDLFPFLDKLDEIVLKHKGRFYLAKDARVSKKVFEQGYPNIDRFRAFRKKIGADKQFQSFQSDRLDI